MRRLIFGLLLFFSYSVVAAEFAAVNGVVYEVYDDEGDAWVLNIYDTSGSVTIPSYITYRGVKYKVTGMCKHDFDASAVDTYNFTSTYSNNYNTIRSATQEAAARERREKAFKHDYDYSRSTIKTLILPNTLEIIQQGAFDGMRSLQTLTIPASVTFFAGSYDYASYKSIFNTYYPNLKSITILGLPYIIAGKDTITYTYQDKDGTFNYVEKIKERFDLSYCRNLKTFSMPALEQKLPVLRAFYKANTDLAIETEKINSALKQVTISAPVLKDEVCVDVQTVQNAYNKAQQYLNALSQNCKSYEQLYDSLSALLKQHPYYDGAMLYYDKPALDLQEPTVSTIEALYKQQKAKLQEKYNELVGGKMERNLRINYPNKYVAGYIILHPEKKDDLERLIYREYRCEETSGKYKYVLAYIEKGTLAQTCRQRQWTSYSHLFESKEDFDKIYDEANTDIEFRSEIYQREAAYSKLEGMKQYVSSHIKKINASNMNKKPNEETSEVIKVLNSLEKSYYYDKAVSYLIQALPKVQKEYEKNGKYFSSEVEFFKAYSSDSYGKILKENKSK